MTLPCSGSEADTLDPLKQLPRLWKKSQAFAQTEVGNDARFSHFWRLARYEAPRKHRTNWPFFPPFLPWPPPSPGLRKHSVSSIGPENPLSPPFANTR